MFYVAHVDNWFQTIPENWVNTARKIIYWPNEKNAIITMWIKKKIQHKSDWEEHTYNCLFGPFGK